MTELSTDAKVSLVTLLKLKLQRPFTSSKITMLIANAIRFIGQYKSFSNAEKKDIVLHAVKDAVSESLNIDEDTKATHLDMIDSIGNEIVNTLVAFANDNKTFIHNKSNKYFSMCCTRKSGSVGSTHTVRAIDEDVYDSLKQHITLNLQKPVTVAKVIKLVAAGVKFVEQYSTLTGAEKKDLVIRVIREVITESPVIDDSLREKLLFVLDMFADDVIDYLIEFGRNMYLKIKSRCSCPCLQPN
jgi:endonuclease III-like uncharacterized protein